MYWLAKFLLPIGTIDKNEIGKINCTLYSEYEMVTIRNGIVTRRVCTFLRYNAYIYYLNLLKCIEVRSEPNTTGSPMKYNSYKKLFYDTMDRYNITLEANITDGSFTLTLTTVEYDIIYTKLKGMPETIELRETGGFIPLPPKYMQRAWFHIYGDCYYIKFD